MGTKTLIVVLLAGVASGVMAQDERGLIGRWFGTLNGISYEFDFADHGRCAIRMIDAAGKTSASTECEYAISGTTVIQYWISKRQDGTIKPQTNQADYEFITDKFMVLDGIPLHKN